MPVDEQAMCRPTFRALTRWSALAPNTESL